MRQELAGPEVREETTGVLYPGDAQALATLEPEPDPLRSLICLFTRFMETIANHSLLSDLELRHEQELAEARAIQLGMLPLGALRTADVTVCYVFQPFHEVGRRIREGAACGAVCGAGGGHAARSS